MDEDHRTSRAENEVGAASEVLCVQTVAVPQAMDEPPDSELGFRVLGPDSAHALATSASREGVETTGFHGAITATGARKGSPARTRTAFQLALLWSKDNTQDDSEF